MPVVVTVIIPNFNHSRFLRQRIDSVLNQTYREFEIVILDDCSTDISREIIDTYRSNNKVKKVIYNEVNSGSPFKQWEKGIQEAEGEWVWIAESDDFCDENFLETAIQQLKQTHGDLFFCQSFNVNETNDIIKDNFWWTDDIKGINWSKPFCQEGKEFIRVALQFKNVIPNASAVVFKRDNFNFKAITQYKNCGDWLFWIDFIKWRKVTYSPLQLNHFRNHLNTTRNLSSRKRMLQREMEELSIKYILLKEGLLENKEQLRLALNKCIDIPSLTLYPTFVKLCLRFHLPIKYIIAFIQAKLFREKVRGV